MNKILYLACFYMTAFIPEYLKADEVKEKIIWADIEYAPFYITKGENKGKGASQMHREAIIKSMPNYIHEIKKLPTTRLFKSLENGEDICFVDMNYTDNRAKTMAYGLATSIHSRHVVVALKENLKNFMNKNGKISLKSLERNPPLSTAISKGRSFDSHIDPFINSGKVKVKHLNLNNTSSSGLQMVSGKRVDFVFEYPEAVNYILRDKEKEIDQLIFIPLSDRKKKNYQMSYLVCSNTQWGQSRVIAINEAIKKVKNTDRYIKAIESWMPNSMLKEFRVDYKKYFVPNNLNAKENAAFQ